MNRIVKQTLKVFDMMGVMFLVIRMVFPGGLESSSSNAR
jgi:hypothetical protein